MRSGYATLVLAASGVPQFIRALPAPPLTESDDAVQLPLLAQNGQLTAQARQRGALVHRGALCVLPNGRTLVARALHDSHDALSQALVERGCDRVVALDRGSHHPVFAHRLGTEMPPLPLYETTVLYALNRSMQPHAFRFAPETSSR